MRVNGILLLLNPQPWKMFFFFIHLFVVWWQQVKEAIKGSSL